MAKFADDAVAVRSNGCDQHTDAARAVAFESDFFILFAFELSRASQDGALDIFVRHIFVFAGEDGGAQTGVRVGIAAADSGGDGDFADHSSEDATALRVGGRL